MGIELEKSGLNRFEKIIKISSLNPIVSKTDEKIKTLVDKMLLTGHRRIPILGEDEKLTGIITVNDVLDSILRGESVEEDVKKIMNPQVIFCEWDERIGYVLHKFKLSKRGGFPVVKNGKVIGIVAERDFIKHFVDVEFGIRVYEIMTKKPFYVKLSSTLHEALRSMASTRYRRLPIVSKERVVGVLSSTDILRYLATHSYNLDELEQNVSIIMIKNIFSISSEKDVSECIKEMLSKNVGGLLVMDRNKRLEGIVTERNVLEQIV